MITTIQFRWFYFALIIGFIFSSCMPAYKSKDPQERLQAIYSKSIKDETIIEKMAMSDPSPRVRATAIEYVTNDVVIQKVIESDPNEMVWLRAINTAKNYAVLTKIAFGNSDLDKRINAAKKAIYLISTASPNADVDLKQQLYEFIVSSSTDESERLAAIEQINASNQEFFTRIALHDKSEELREFVTKKITSQDTLLAIIKKEKISNIRHTAFSRIDESRPDILIELALQEHDHYIQTMVQYKIESEDIFLEIINHPDASENVAVKAVYNLENQLEIKNIVTNHPKSAVRVAAISRLRDKKFLLSLFGRERESNIRDAIAEALIKKGDLILITKVAVDESISPAIRKKTIRHLKDIKILRQLRENNELWNPATEQMLRISSAIERINKAVKRTDCQSDDCTYNSFFKSNNNQLSIINQLDFSCLAIIAYQGEIPLTTLCCSGFYIKPGEKKAIGKKMGPGFYTIFYIFSDDMETPYRGQNFVIEDVKGSYSVLKLTVDDSMIKGETLRPLYY